MNLQDYIQRIKLWINKTVFYYSTLPNCNYYFSCNCTRGNNSWYFLSFSRGKGSNTIRPIQ